MNSKRISSRVIKVFIAFFVFCLLSFVLIFSCSKTPTKTEGITISGRVVLEDTTDYSGVRVMLFKPVEIDTALTNLNERYPGVGIEIKQRTEFYWREHTPFYTTTTNKNGEWKFENIPDGEYHVVVQKDGYGWRIKYNIKSRIDIVLRKMIEWKGYISGTYHVLEGSYIFINGNVNFLRNSNLIVEQGTIIDFSLDGNINIEGNIFLLGDEKEEIQVISSDLNNNNYFKVLFSDSSIIKHVIFRNIKNGLILKNCNNIIIESSSFIESYQGIEGFDSKFKITNCYFKGNNIGILRTNVRGDIENNLFFNNKNYSILAHNEMGSSILKNVFIKCIGSAIATNLGSKYSYDKILNFKINNNDFINNNIHIDVGRKSLVVCNFNNFIKNNEWIIKTDQISYYDTLDFRYNFFNLFSPLEIADKIYDGKDRTDLPTPGPIVDFRDFYFAPVKWLKL